MERYIPVLQTRPKPPRAWLLFLQAGYKRAVLGTTILSNGKEHFGPTDRNDQTGQRGPPSKLVPNIPVGPNRNGPFHLMYQPKLPEFWVEWKAPFDRSGHFSRSDRNVPFHLTKLLSPVPLFFILLTRTITKRAVVWASDRGQNRYSDFVALGTLLRFESCSSSHCLLSSWRRFHAFESSHPPFHRTVVFVASVPCLRVVASLVSSYCCLRGVGSMSSSRRIPCFIVPYSSGH